MINKFEGVPDKPTLSNMEDVFNVSLQRKIETREVDYSKAATLEDLLDLVNRQDFILGDDGEHFTPMEVLSAIHEHRFNDIPKLNGLRHNAQRVLQNQSDNRLEY